MMIGLIASLTAVSGLWVNVPQKDAAPGQMCIVTERGPGPLMPLKGTKVEAQVSGLVAEVTLRQEFRNLSTSPIEAVYTFPLPEGAAVNRMRFQIGDRVIEGQIKERSEAEHIYQQAKAAGQAAALLNQERANIFTQSIANILPKQDVFVEISYIETIAWKDGEYEFSFPMVVGPRFLPAATHDPDKVSPPIVPEGTRSGANIDLSVAIKTGSGIRSMKSVLHAVETINNSGNTTVKLSRKDEIPNRDFILRWTTEGDEVQTSAYFDPEGGGTGSFSLILAPPKAAPVEIVRDREVIFVVDQSGSQSGFPIEKSKELTEKLIRSLHPEDTFNVISFSNGAQALWSRPRQFNSGNAELAISHVRGLRANGGTMILPAVELALKSEPVGGRLRLVVFNTDGFVGNDYEILDGIQRMRGTSRMFTFGIGNSVNRFLIDAMSVEGRGDSEIVTLAESADAAVERFVRRVDSPLLTNIKVSFSDRSIYAVTPEHVPDMFSSEPVIIYGKYSRPGPVKVKITGELGGEPWSKTIDLVMPSSGDRASGLSALWAKRRIQDIERWDWLAKIGPTGGALEDPDRMSVVQQVTDLALKYRLMTEHTSFVAVEKRVINIGGKQRTIQVPVDMADGVSYDGLGLPSSKAPPAIAGSASGGFGGGGLSKQAATTGRNYKHSSRRSELSELDDVSGTASKIAASLKAKKGEQEIKILVADIDDEIIVALKKAGMKVDDQDRGLKLIFGRVDAAKLEDLAKVDGVVFISAL